MPELVGLIAASILSGYALRKGGLVRAEAAKAINRVIFLYFLPCLIFQALQGAHLKWSMLAMPLVAWISILSGLAIGWVAARLAKQPPTMTVAIMLAATFGNTIFFGYPITRALFGSDRLTLAILFDLMGVTLAVNTLGTFLASSVSGKTASFASLVKRIAALPSIWALVLGLALQGVQFDPMIGMLLEKIGSLAVPGTMLALGLSLRLRDLREDLPLVLLASSAKLLLLPSVVLGICLCLRLPLEMRQAAVIQSSMPTMLLVFNLALFFDVKPKFILNVIMASTLLCLFTIPVWHFILTH